MDRTTRLGVATDRANAKLGETHFGDPGTFQDVLTRHGLEYGTELDVGPTKRELWKNPERELLLQTGADPLTGDIERRRDDGTDTPRAEPGYAGSVYVEGPHDLAHDLFADIIVSAAHIRAEHAPLTDPTTGEISVSLYTHRGPPFDRSRTTE